MESFTEIMIDAWTSPQTNETRISGAGPQVMVFCESGTDDSDATRVENHWSTKGPSDVSKRKSRLADVFTYYI